MKHTSSSFGLHTVFIWSYILHPCVIILLQGFVIFMGISAFFTDNRRILYVTVCAASLVFMAGAAALSSCTHRQNTAYKKASQRAWIELDRDALRQNINNLYALLPKNCEIMAVLKANAYGHGAIEVARELSQAGVTHFCTACVAEAVELRRHGIRGTILILGYTSPAQFPLLFRYHLTQTAVDYPYALLLNQYKKRLHVHLGIDTGMHRLGERSENIDRICEILQMKHLSVDGIFTHLCASDIADRKGREFTNMQVQEFFQVIKKIRENGLSCPKLHIQSSCGILNYPELSCDYARIGIALYGVLGSKEEMIHCQVPLKPVLSLKARVSSVRPLYRGEYAGYGLTFTAEHDMKLCTLTIGYADGLPRSLSNSVGSVLIHGQKAPIIGRICMDQTTVDVTHIPDVKPGDEAVLIGISGNMEITAEEIARQAGTITNEILSRLGSRVKRVTLSRSNIEKSKHR